MFASNLSNPDANPNVRLIGERWTSHFTNAGSDGSLVFGNSPILERTEEVHVNGKLMKRGIDYTTNYKEGVFTFREPPPLLNTDIVATYDTLPTRSYVLEIDDQITSLRLRMPAGSYGRVEASKLEDGEAGLTANDAEIVFMCNGQTTLEMRCKGTVIVERDPVGGRIKIRSLARFVIDLGTRDGR